MPPKHTDVDQTVLPEGGSDGVIARRPHGAEQGEFQLPPQAIDAKGSVKKSAAAQKRERDRKKVLKAKEAGVQPQGKADATKKVPRAFLHIYKHARTLFYLSSVQSVIFQQRRV